MKRTIIWIFALLLLIFTVQAVTLTEIEENMMSFYKMENNTTLIDDRNICNGTQDSAPYLVDGLFDDYAFWYNGTQRSRVNNTCFRIKNSSISSFNFWIKTNRSSQGGERRRVFGYRAGPNDFVSFQSEPNNDTYLFVLYLGGIERFNFRYPLIENTSWNMITVTNNGSHAFIYLNDSLIDSGTTDGYWFNNISAVDDVEFFISNFPTSSAYYQGRFDNFRIFNDTLTQEDVSVLYASVTENYDEIIYTNRDAEMQLIVPGTYTADQLDVVLEWNSTNFTAVPTGSTATTTIYNLSIEPPNIGSPLNITHRWHYNITTDYEQTSDQEQQLFPVFVNFCNASIQHSIFNITYFDEVSLASINVTNNFQFSINDGINSYDFSGEFRNDSFTHSVCTNLNTKVVPYNWNLWGTMNLQKPDYITKILTFTESAPILVSNNPTTNASYSMITISNSTTVTYNWLSNSYQSLDGTMRIYQCSGDTRTLISSENIVSGTASSNIQLLTQSYSYDVIIDGTVYQGANYYTCHVETQTSRTFFVQLIETDVSQQIGMSLIPCTMTKPTATTAQMTWGDNPESNATITGCLQAFRSSIYGFVQIFENCTTTPPIVNSIPVNAFDYYVRGKLTQLDSTTYCATELNYAQEKDTAKSFGPAAIFGIIILIASLGLIFAGDGELVLIGGAVGLIVAFVLGVTQFPWKIVAATITFLLIIVYIGRSAKND